MEDPGKASWVDFLLSVGKPLYREEHGAARGRSKPQGQESPSGSLAKWNTEHKENSKCVSRNLEGRYRKRYQTMLIRVDENKMLVLPGGLHCPQGASVIFSHHVDFAAGPLMSSPLFTFEPWLSHLWRV